MEAAAAEVEMKKAALKVVTLVMEIDTMETTEDCCDRMRSLGLDHGETVRALRVMIYCSRVQSPIYTSDPRLLRDDAEL